MWSTFEKLKDNITQIASDVLDTQEDVDGEGEGYEEGVAEVEDGETERQYNGGHKGGRFRARDDGLQDISPSELEYYKGKGDHLQTDVEAAMMKYAALLEEKEAEVSILREENKFLKEQILINSTKQEGLLANGFIKGDRQSDAQFLEENQREIANGHSEDLTEQLKEEKATSVKPDTQLGIAETSEENGSYANSSDLSRTEMQEVNGPDEPVPLISLVEAKLNEREDKELELHEVPLHEDPMISEAESEQVSLLSQRLRASEEVCSSLETKLEEVSLERDTLGKRLEEVSLERDTLENKLEEVSLDRATFKKRLEEVSLERDKAVQNLGRLRQNLLDMESSTSEKMDNDSLLISDLELRLKTSEECVGHLQQALTKSQDDLAEANRSNALRSMDTNEEIDILKQRLQTCLEALDSKDMELANLQSALGQYYAESDAQERLELELRAVRELNARLSRDLKVTEGTLDVKVQELDLSTKKLASVELLNEELKRNTLKLEQQALQLRTALEQSITSLNRMSSDSDYYVDRRIVIKLLVTYFQRHHSREVLDLMVRMLGFSEEDKRRVGLAQQGARVGMVRSVFNVPGRIVGGILGSSESDNSPRPAPGENQSFADLWIDFLLKETQERERREREEGGNKVANPAPMSPMASVTRSMPSSPSGGHHHRPSSSFSGFPSSFLLPPKPNRVPSTSDLQSVSTADSYDNSTT